MRVMVVSPGPYFSVHDVFNGWVKGLRKAGAEVGVLDFGSRLEFFTLSFQFNERLDAWVNPYSDEQNILLASDSLYAEMMKGWPDVVVIISGFFVPKDFYDLARFHGKKVVNIFTESPYEDDGQAIKAAFADLNLINDPTNIDSFPPGTMYAPHSYDPDIHYPGTGVRPIDFSFVGTGYESRTEFFRGVDLDGLNVRIEGNWPLVDETHPLRSYFTKHPEECLDNAETAALYRQTKVTANLYRREANAPELAAGWAMGPREVEAAACQCFMLRDPRPESDEVLGMFPTFDGPEDLSEQLKWWLGHDTERERASELAASAIADRTFEQAARRLLTKLER